MKIVGDSGLANVDAYVRNVRDRKRVDSSSSERSGNIASKDEVVLSNEAKRIQQAKEGIDSLPDIRKEKVDDIRARIERGDYQVDAEKIASKIIEESLIYELS